MSSADLLVERYDRCDTIRYISALLCLRSDNDMSRVKVQPKRLHLYFYSYGRSIGTSRVKYCFQIFQIQDFKIAQQLISILNSRRFSCCSNISVIHVINSQNACVCVRCTGANVCRHVANRSQVASHEPGKTCRDTR